MNNRFSFEGTKNDLYIYLTKDLNIIEHHIKDVRKPGRYQLTPLKEQIENIYSSLNKTGTIFFSEEYEIKHSIDEQTKLKIIEEDTYKAFHICRVSVKITD